MSFRPRAIETQKKTGACGPMQTSTRGPTGVRVVHSIALAVLSEHDPPPPPVGKASVKIHREATRGERADVGKIRARSGRKGGFRNSSVDVDPQKSPRICPPRTCPKRTTDVSRRLGHHRGSVPEFQMHAFAASQLEHASLKEPLSCSLHIAHAEVQMCLKGKHTLSLAHSYGQTY